MSRYKTAFDGEWVKIMPLVNTKFVPVDPACELCRSMSCAPAWYSIKTRRIRCLKCFTPKQYFEWPKKK